MKYLCLYLLCLFQFSRALVFSQAGSLDLSFSGNGKQRALVGNILGNGYCMAIQLDQKILVGGEYEQDAQFGGGYSMGVIRFLTDGSIDKNFGNTGRVTFIFGGAQADAAAMALQPDGKILLTGTYSYNSTSSIILTRLDSTGLVDNTFNNGGSVFLPNYQGLCIALQPDGKIIVGGNYVVPGSPIHKIDFGIVRFNNDGTLDNTFGTNGQVFTDVGGVDRVSGTLLQPDGKIVVTGTRDNDYFVTVRYTSNGSLDYSFGSGGKSYVSFGDGQYCASGKSTLQSDGKILITGDYTTKGYADNIIVVRLNSNGSLDNGFAGNGKKGINFNGFDFGSDIAVQTNGKIIVVGYTGYLNTNNPTQFAICRLNIDGSFDTGFGNGGKATAGWNNYSAYATAVGIQSNGRIVATGTSGPDYGVMRFLATGSNQSNAQVLEGQQTVTPELSNIRIYPNPASNQLLVSGLEQDGSTILTVMDISGKRLLSRKADAQSNYTIDISQLAPGNYLLIINGSKKQQSIPFIKTP